MDEKTQAIVNAAADVGSQKTGKEMDASKMIRDATTEVESPLDKVERLNKETEKMLGEITEIKKDMEKLSAFNALSGKAQAGTRKEVTPEETRQTQVQELANKLTAVTAR